MYTIDASVWVSAFEPNDALHAPSRDFLERVAETDLPVYGPAFALLEIGCAIGRRTGREDFARKAAAHFRAFPGLMLLPVDQALLEEALKVGLDRRLRAADSLYAAIARKTGSILVSWDRELVGRANARTPYTLRL